MTAFYIANTNIQCLLDTFTALSYDLRPDSLPLCTSGNPCLSAGIESISIVSTIRLYPNPNTGSFTLQTSNNIGSDYTISDMLGHIIMQRSIRSDSEVIALSDAAEGVYTLAVKSAQPIRFVVVR